MQSKIIFLIWALLLFEYSASKTVTHRRTTIDENGKKTVETWTTTEPDDPIPKSFNLSSEEDSSGYRTIVRNGITYKVKPQIKTMRIGGTNLATDELVRQAGMIQGVDVAAVRELLETKKPIVKTTTDEKGQKSTTTYQLEPDGSILGRTVTDIDPETLETQFPQSFASTPNDKNKINDWEWNPSSAAAPSFRRPTSDWPKITPSTRSGFGSFDSKWPSSDDMPERRRDPDIQLPKTWNPLEWSHRNAARPSIFDSKHEDPFDFIDTRTPGTVTRTFVDDDGHTVHTTYTVGPTKKTPTPDSVPIQAETPNKKLPSLEDFIKTQYETTTVKVVPRMPGLREVTTPKTIMSPSPNDRPVKKINIDDLPLMILNNSELTPLVGPQTPLKTLKVDNIPQRETVETTNVKSITKTVHSSALPTTEDLDPSMQDILKRAGIDPNDITSANGDTITKTRIEPDGKIVRTTYRVRTVPATPRSDDLHPTYTKPTAATTPHSVGGPNKAKFPIFPRFGFENEPLDTPRTINPLYLHPLDTTRVPTLLPAPKTPTNPIDDFLSKIGLRASDIEANKGEFAKTLVDDDGRVLTVKFLLSSVKMPDTEPTTTRRAPIK